MKKTTLLLSILLLIITIAINSCKKGDTPGANAVPTAEELAKSDLANNSALITQLGNIYMTEKYPANAVDVPLAIFSFGRDSLCYMGNTDATGAISSVTGYQYYNSTDNVKYTMSITDDKKTLLFGSINSNNVADNLMYSVSSYQDTLIRTIAYNVNYTNQTKDVLFDILESKAGIYAPSTEKVVLGGDDGRNDNVDKKDQELTNSIKDLVLEYIGCLPDHGISKWLGQQQQKLSANNAAAVDPQTKVKLDNSLQAEQKASDFFEKITNSVSSLKATPKTNLTGTFDKAQSTFDAVRKYFSGYNTTLNFNLTKISGDAQVVNYGTPIDNLVLSTTRSDGTPISLGGQGTLTFGSKVVTGTIETDKNGQGVIRIPAFNISLESGGQKTLKADFVFGAEATLKKVSFLITVNPRPALQITADATTNNQTAQVNATIGKPLKIRVLDANNVPEPYIKINWTENTPGVTTTGLASAQTTTDASGYSTNYWTLKGAVGTVHNATATINQDTLYAITKAAVTFNATTIANIDSTSIYRAAMIGTWTVTHYDPVNPQAVYTMDLLADGTGKYHIPNATNVYPMSWSISKSGNKYFYFESGFWNPAYNGLNRDALSYPLKPFKLYASFDPNFVSVVYSKN